MRAVAAISSRVPVAVVFLSAGFVTSSTTVGISVMREDVVRINLSMKTMK